ncbi:MAG TPA: glycine--tRNA ligase subunit beta [Pusillimonas sp.]|uniref:glycine--tRNA ligase subunit beta n=1 Tax=Pusillimonas sp. TaxID=3040095 RepID=UPI002BFF0507|nr:glycine--tRNA ligase subunit beta [Pusillimonas sp.]HUH88333.1 glycine--tRNA ligase subunit beta [Pusillimonas sp.]
MSQAQSRPLLIELLTEELPPKALQKLGEAFAQGIRQVLESKNLVSGESVMAHFATPRRLAVLLDSVLGQAPQQSYSEKLMPVKVGLTESGEPTPALLKKLAGKGLQHLQPADLIRESDGKQEYLYANGMAQGAMLTEGLQEAIDTAIANLPIPKVMRYQLADGVTSVRFVRPAHGLVALWGADIIEVEALGLKAGRRTAGHRFMGSQTLEIPDATAYENLLKEQGKVIASFSQRRSDIQAQLDEHAARLGAILGTDPEVEALLDEVTALVEHPTIYAGQFDPVFLEVPPECLILTMRLNQKYFPLFEPATGKLTHHFLIVSNMRVDDPRNIVQGNERVVRPRLADARFFFDQDRKQPLVDSVAALADSVYHNKLGSQLQRTERVRKIAVYLAQKLGADTSLADRAALLAKADLVSNMVAEFPELQGIMGAYYAQADGEHPDVVAALRDQYRIRLDAPVDTTSLVGTILFIAERAETLVGIWGIGLVPTGERDPYGLRRAALGIISAFEQLSAGAYLSVPDDSRLTVSQLLDAAFATFNPADIAADTPRAVQGFIYERYRNQLAADHDKNVIDAVLAPEPPLHEVRARIEACATFARRPEAESLAAANKRIGNILKKSDEAASQVDAAKLTEEAERSLAKVIAQIKPAAQEQFEQGDFTSSLATLAQARSAVDTFFNDVMVMAEDPAVRANRLALLTELHAIMNRVADISRLAS